jgi:hypothetical protein
VLRPGTCLLAQLLRCFRGVAVQVLVEVPEVEVGELLLVRQQWARWRWVRDVSAATSSSLVRHLGVTGTGVTVQAATTAAWVAKLRHGHTTLWLFTYQVQPDDFSVPITGACTRYLYDQVN